MESLFQFAGRLHPMLLHAPLGLLIGLVVVEILALVSRKPLGPETRSALAWLTALSAAASAITGFILSYESGYTGDTVQLHQWLGISVAAGAIAAAVTQQAGKFRLYAVLLALTCGVMFPAGHLGATLTHGANFLFEPFRLQTASTPRTSSSPSSASPSTSDTPIHQPAGQTQPATLTFARDIAPILASRCISCHGDDKTKGGLALHTPQAILAGGDAGPVIVPGDAAASELLYRLKLPIDDDDHMPPDGKAQLTPEQIAAIEKWIAEGARIESHASVPPSGTRGASGGSSSADPNSGSSAGGPSARSTAPPPAAPPEALAALRRALVHVEPIALDSTLLVVDASAIARNFGDDQARRLLEPLQPNIADLNLARTKITDASLAFISKMPALRRLNLTATAITDSGIAPLAGHASLEYLTLSQTAISDAAAGTLEGLPSLKRLYVWRTAFTGDSLASLRRRLPRVPIDAGDAAPAAALEAETVVTLVDPANPAAPITPPPVPTPAPPAADALKPVNTACPVSGKPIDPNFAIVYKGRVIAFCCRVCLGQFLDDPTKFESKLD